MIRLLFVHPHAIISQGIITALQEKTGIEVVAYVTSTEQAIAYLEQASCDIVFASATLPNNGAIQLANIVSSQGYSAKILVIDIIPSIAVILTYLEAGVSGYVEGGGALDDLSEAVYALHHGVFSISPSVATALIARIHQLRMAMDATKGRGKTVSSGLLSTLTEREYEIFLLLVDNYSNRQIADKLLIEVGTTKNHIHNLMRKLKIEKREHVHFFV